MYLVHITIIPIPFASVFRDVECIIFSHSVFNAFVSPAFHSAWLRFCAQLQVSATHSDSYQLIITVLSNHWTKLEQYSYTSYINRLDRKDSWTVINITYTRQVWLIVLLYSFRLPINSLGPKFSSQGHFHSLQLLNVPQFLFSRLVRLKTAPRGNFSHA